MRRGLFGPQFWLRVKVICLVLVLLTANLEAVQSISWQQTGSMSMWTCLLPIFLRTCLEILAGGTDTCMPLTENGLPLKDAHLQSTGWARLRPMWSNPVFVCVTDLPADSILTVGAYCSLSYSFLPRQLGTTFHVSALLPRTPGWLPPFSYCE